MLGRLVHKADFEKALASPSRIRSAHFALHHVAVNLAVVSAPGEAPSPEKLSTGREDNSAQSVDDSDAPRLLGCVVPKRHARRAVTRNLLKRQIRACAERSAAGLAPGAWVVRLRAPFAREQFPSATSAALAQAARSELEQLFARATRPGRRAAAGAGG